MIVYGRNVAKEVLSNNLKINKVLLQEGYSDQELIDELNKRNVNIKYLNKNMMKFKDKFIGKRLKSMNFKTL